MRVSMRIALGLAAFLGVAGIVFAVTSREWRGTVMLLVCAVAIGYVGLVLRGAVRAASVPVTGEALASEELEVESEHIGPTIWPFVLSIAALLLVIGLVAVHWVLIPTGILFIGAGAGWFLDIKRQRHLGELGLAHQQATPGGGSTLEDQQHPDGDDGD
jgi:Cytochrome c oxidase subunit IV